jgi:serine phosphatase RsbU (regulator of sigma subunit)
MFVLLGVCFYLWNNYQIAAGKAASARKLADENSVIADEALLDAKRARDRMQQLKKDAELKEFELEDLRSTTALLYNHRQQIQEQSDQIKQMNVALEDEKKVTDQVVKELQEKNKQVTDSLRYATTIQQALLPDQLRLSNMLFHDYFIYYKPKDIVSGDFYWAHHSDRKSILAVADCTGHGVPGAFMSMIGHNLLNSIIREMRLYDPGMVLDILNSELKKVLKQGDSRSGDGMDIGLYTLERQEDNTILLEYSGSHSIFYVFDITRNSLTRYKGQRGHLGLSLKNKQVSFITEQLVLKEGDQLYMLTDGFVDQPNEEGQKFGSHRLEQLLANISSLSFKRQFATLTESFEHYTLNSELRDDVTFIGIKL